MLKNLCPGCMKHCYLDEPRCERGREYANTGTLPPRKPRPDGEHGGGKRSEQKMKYLAMKKEEKIIQCLKDIWTATENSTETMFGCLRNEEQSDLLILLEKVRHDWIHRTKEQG